MKRGGWYGPHKWVVWLNTEDIQPEKIGWYPTLWIMPDNEGIMPGSAWWNSEKWSNNYVDYFMKQTCETKEQAEATAYKNDVEI